MYSFGPTPSATPILVWAPNWGTLQTRFMRNIPIGCTFFMTISASAAPDALIEVSRK